MDTLKIILFYGGDAATVPREQLLNWLRTPQVAAIIGRKIEAKKVADWPPNSGATVHDRVSEAIEWADKALLLITPDPRGVHGAPNVLDEFGRWLGRKGGQSMAVLRHVDVLPHSNAEGLIYIKYQRDIVQECKDHVLAFLQQPIMGLDNRKTDTLSPEEVELLQLAKNNRGFLMVLSDERYGRVVSVSGKDFRDREDLSIRKTYLDALKKLIERKYVERESEDYCELTGTGWKVAKRLAEESSLK